MPHFAFSNGLIAQALVDHFGNGIPLETLARRAYVKKSALCHRAHRVAGMLEGGTGTAIRLLLERADPVLPRTLQAQRQRPAGRGAGERRVQGAHPEVHRFFQWVAHPEVEAENNLAERRLRPLVIARKVCFGSQSEKGLKTRETLMTIIDTLRLRHDDPVAKLSSVLDSLARDKKADVGDLLWGADEPQSPKAPA